MSNEMIASIGCLHEKFWPGKFDDRDSDRWVKKLEGYSLRDVESAIMDFNDKAVYPPRLFQIVELIEASRLRDRQSNPLYARKWINPAARQFAELNPKFSDEPETTILIRYYQSLYDRKLKEITERYSYLSPTLTAEKIEKINARKADELSAAARHATISCSRDLVQLGVDMEEADKVAAASIAELP